MADINQLLQVMAKLRDRNGGCPWDIEQTFQTISAYTIEEAYEVAEAIERGDMDDLKDELGDLLLQVVFHAQMASEQQQFSFADVVDAIVDKLIRRHPHVFGDASIADADAQTKAWDAQKALERAQKRGSAASSVLDDVPRGLPEWQRAWKLQKRAANLGFDWPSPVPVIAKLHEEIDEVRTEFERGDPRHNHDRLEDELGDLLFVAVNLCRHARVDAGSALRRANTKFERRFRHMELSAAQQKITLDKLSLQQQEMLWDKAKAEENLTGKLIQQADQIQSIAED